MVQILLKYLEDHPDQVLKIVQDLVEILKAKPDLMPQIIAQLAAWFNPKA